jgi:hypothetical protein
VLVVPLLITIVLALFYFRLAFLDGAKKVGWDGRGPGIFMFAAILVAFVLSSALVLGTKAFLGWPMDKGLPARQQELWRDPNGASLTLDETLDIPPVYGVTGGLLLLGITVSLAGVLPACLWLVRRGGLLPMRPPEYSGEGPRLRQPPTYFSDIDVDPGLPAQLPGRERQNLTYRRRRVSALAQRGEAAFGLLTLLIWLAAVLAIAASAFRSSSESGSMFNRGVLEAVAGLIHNNLSGWGIILAATLILAFMVKNAATSKEERPLAILWDIMCFLPNAAHPFGAPSYSNRVVPELARRVSDWIDPQSGAGRKNRVLMSAHSLGAVVAIAAIFHLKASRPDLDFRRIRLLTYGVQLRPYFGRFFPELFGPDVLGICPTQGPSLFSADPWKKAREREVLEPGSADMTLRALLGGPDKEQVSPVWKNIWRRTDYLGFPAYAHSGQDNHLDVYAVETEPKHSQFVVATHGNYTATTTYSKVREEMLADWPCKPSWLAALSCLPSRQRRRRTDR